MKRLIDSWQRLRKSPYSGDIGVGLGAYFLARAVPVWVGVWQPSDMEAAAVGLAVALLSLSFDLMPDEGEPPA